MDFKPISLGSKVRAREDEKKRQEGASRKRVLDELLDHNDNNEDYARDQGRTNSASGRVNESPTPFVPQGPKRHFAERPRSMKSGPGTLENDAFGPFGSLGPTGRGTVRPSRFGEQQSSSFQDTTRLRETHTAVMAKVSNLPQGTDDTAIRKFFADYPNLEIIKIERLPPTGQAPTGRPALMRKITFAQSVTARDLDSAVHELNDKLYLGRGYYLHIDRWVGATSRAGAQQKEPFAAEWREAKVPKGVAPTEDLGGAAGRTHARLEQQPASRLVVTARQPTEARVLKLIHGVVSRVLREGKGAESALMDHPRVINDERFAWLYDQKHPHNVYYRWKLYEETCNDDANEIIRDCGHWEFEGHSLAYEFSNEVYHLNPSHQDTDMEEEEEGDTYRVSALNPGAQILDAKSRTELMWLLARMPRSHPLNSDVGDVCTFAVVDHPKMDPEEMVTYLISNIFKPFCLTELNPSYRADRDSSSPYNLQVITNAFRLASDIALVAQGGAAWKYRQTIGHQLKDHQVFEFLAERAVDKDAGKLSKQYLKDSINTILAKWEEQKVYDDAMMAHFMDAFNSHIDKEGMNKKMQRRTERLEKVANATNLGQEPSQEYQNPQGKVSTDDGDKPSNQSNDLDRESNMGVLSKESTGSPKATLPVPQDDMSSTATPARRRRPRAEDFL